MVLPLLALLAAASAPVYQTGPAVFHAPSAQRAEALEAKPAVRPLPAAARHDLPALPPAAAAELATPDSRGGYRRKAPALKIGIARDLPERVGFAGVPEDLPPGRSAVVAGGLFERGADGALTWTAAFSSAGAGAVRLHFASAQLPAGSRVYVYTADGETHGPYAFERGTRAEGFWTNTVYSAEVYLQVRFPAGAFDATKAALSVASVIHIDAAFARGAAAGTSRPKSQTCFVDEACVTPAEFPNVADASDAVASLTFDDGGVLYLCSGGLLNASPATFVPYLLTANHCFNTQASATSLEALWQYVRSSCNGPEPSPAGFPRTLGSTLLATGETSDFTLVQLSQDPPDGSVFLGWTTEDLTHAQGTLAYRLSYPDGRPQFYTKESIISTPDPFACSDAPQGPYLYEKDVVGGTGGGSSGAPLYLEDLRVIGQLGGACGTNPGDDCDSASNSSIDGAFRVTFPLVQSWLAPVGPGSCTPDATTLCLNGGRFRVNVAWSTDTGSGAGQAESLTGDSGYFWFFNPANIELIVKVLNGCGISGNHFWVFAGGLTNVGVVLTVTDTKTGAQKTYTNPRGTAFVPIQDTSAFACP